MRILSILSLATLLMAQQPRYAEAIKALNNGRIPEAKALFEKLLTGHPDYFRGYSAIGGPSIKSGIQKHARRSLNET
jgi:hypothetical protein